MMSSVPGEEGYFPSEILEGSSWMWGRKAMDGSLSLWHEDERKALKLSQLLPDSKKEKIES